MSVGKSKKSSPPRRQDEEEEGQAEGGENSGVAQKVRGGGGGGGGGKKAASARYGRCFSGLDLSVGPGPLRDVDAGKLKSQIRRWARAVVAYARQLSFGSPRSSPRMSKSSGATPRSATFPSKSGLAGAKAEPDHPP